MEFLAGFGLIILIATLHGIYDAFTKTKQGK